MRTTVLHILPFAALFLFGGALGSVSSKANAQSAKQASCVELNDQRNALMAESRSYTSQVEAKNTELGETADALSAAKAEPRKKELSRRVEGLKRELSVLLDRENESVNRLGALDAEIAKRCRKGGGK